MNSVAIQLPDSDAGNVAMPDVARAFTNHDRFHLGFSGLVKQTQFHGVRAFRMQRKVHAQPIPCRALRVRLSGQDCEWQELVRLRFQNDYGIRGNFHRVAANSRAWVRRKQ